MNLQRLQNLNNRRLTRAFLAEARKRGWLKEKVTSFEDLENWWKLDEHIERNIGLAGLLGLTSRPAAGSEQETWIVLLEDRIRSRIAGPRRRHLHEQIDQALERVRRPAPIVEDEDEREDYYRELQRLMP